MAIKSGREYLVPARPGCWDRTPQRVRVLRRRSGETLPTGYVPVRFADGGSVLLPIEDFVGATLLPKGGAA